MVVEPILVNISYLFIRVCHAKRRYSCSSPQSAAHFFHNNGGETVLGNLLAWALLGVAYILIAANHTKFVKEIQIGIWAAIATSPMFFYISRDDITRQGRRLMVVIVPGHPIQLGSARSEVLIYKNAGSHFETQVHINGLDVRMLADTGATDIILTSEDARLVGFHPENLEYDVPVRTAAGLTNTTAVTLNFLSIGTIRRWSVPALVSKLDELEQSLLGMTFISTLKSFHMTSDELCLDNNGSRILPLRRLPSQISHQPELRPLPSGGKREERAMRTKSVEVDHRTVTVNGKYLQCASIHSLYLSLGHEARVIQAGLYLEVRVLAL